MADDARPYHHGDLRAAVLGRAAEIIGEEGIETLSLRAIARDLGVSHGAPNRHFKTKSELLTALATEAWLAARDATLTAIDGLDSSHPYMRLNAMGRAYLKWALGHRALFAVIQHPDVARYANEELHQAINEFWETIHQVVDETRTAGRHPDVNPDVLTLYTNAVPYGLAGLLTNPALQIDSDQWNEDDWIAELIELVVPIKHLRS